MKKNNNKIIVVALVILAVFLSANALGGNAWAGGWEVTNGMNTLNVDEVASNVFGSHYATSDTDGDYFSGVYGGYLLEPIYNPNPPPPSPEPTPELPKFAGQGDNPDIVVEMSYPRYLKTDGTYTATYDVEYGQDEKVRYIHWEYLYDVTIKTDADKYYKPFGSYWDYGWFFEANVVPVTVNTNFGLNAWTVSGTDGDWQLEGGWAGIMSASIYGVSFGLVDSSASENYGHVIQNIHSQGAALNIFTQSFSFEDSNGLKDVPSSVSIDLSAKLGAGASYTVDLLSRWDSISVRNVFVKYTVKVDVVTVLQWKAAVGNPIPLSDPNESNTNYAPQNGVANLFNAILDGIMQFGFGFIMPILVLVVIVVVVIFVIRPLLNRRRK